MRIGSSEVTFWLGDSGQNSSWTEWFTVQTTRNSGVLKESWYHVMSTHNLEIPAVGGKEQPDCSGVSRISGYHAVEIPQYFNNTKPTFPRIYLDNWPVARMNHMAGLSIFHTFTVDIQHIGGKQYNYSIYNYQLFQKVILPITIQKHCLSPGLKESAVFLLHSWRSGIAVSKGSAIDNSWCNWLNALLFTISQALGEWRLDIQFSTKPSSLEVKVQYCTLESITIYIHGASFVL